MLFRIIFCYAIALVTGGKITYTKESWTTDSKPCITDCIDKKCIARWGDAHVSCVPGDTPALTYYTTQRKPPHHIWCISRCGAFNKKENDNRCYVSEYDWDNCNPERGTTIIVDKAFTVNDARSGPCKDKCGYKNKEYLWCQTYDDSWDRCELEGHTYVQSQTVDGLVCPGICGRRGTHFNLCVGADKSWHDCAPPGRDFSLFSKMSEKCVAAKECTPCSLLRKQTISRVCVVDTCQSSSHNSYVLDYVNSLERPDNYLITRNVNEKGNSIYRYTIMPPALKDDPTLPLLVRARVTGATLRSRRSDDRNNIPGKVDENVRRMGMKSGRQDGSYDESGRLIGYMLGGPDEIYNFVPQNQRLLQGEGSQWFTTENIISEYIHQSNGWAEISVLVVYKDLPYTTRPDGFAGNVALYDRNNRMYGECNNSYYTNDAR